MAKKKESTFNSWTEVSDSMKVLTELQVKKEKLEGEQTVKINKIKAEYQEKAGDLNVQIKDIEKNIERFADSHKDEFLKNRTKNLAYGTVSYRLTKKVVCKNTESAIKGFKALGLENYLRIKEELNKDEILQNPDEKAFVKVGVSVVPEDKIKIEPNVIKFTAEIGVNEEVLA
jgi:phage host-nuclease inhibitor protein Gam